ncbi:MAG: nitrogen fixation protein NifH [Thermoplasmata archaeon]|nr:MAG: nitrogen fixation protein NifH [Thermoplasmata archaeon]
MIHTKHSKASKVSNWKSFLKNDPVQWLLEPDNPSVRYFTLRDIQGISDKNKDVITAKKEIMTEGLVPKILAKQKAGGYWGKPEDFYERSKYRGTVWNFIILAELGADGNDKRIKLTSEFILKWSQDKRSGGFAHQGSKYNGGQHSGVIPCLTGNLLWSLIRFGYLNDPRIKKGIRWITTYQRFDDKIKVAPTGWPYDRWKNCWGRHSCHMGVVKIMKALAEIPKSKRTKAVNRTIEEGAEYLLKHHIYKRSRNLKKVSKPQWVKFGFPLMYQSDAMEVMGILTRLGFRDDRMQEALDLILSKQNEEGKWNLENTFNGRYLVNIEHKDKPSKWVTMNAIKVLKQYYG